MSSKTKIVVLHMKEIIYTGIFIFLAILFIVLLFIMFGPSHKDEKQPDKAEAIYNPGTYTSTLCLNNSNIEIEVVVDEYNINSIQMNHLDETVATMYPLITPTFDELVQQICEGQSLDDITYSSEAKYTSTILLSAVKEALDQATIKND